MLPLRGVANDQALATTVAGYDDAGLVFLDLKAESDRLLGTYLHEALTLSLAGIIVIVVLLSISLRSPRRTVAVLLPLAAAVICTAAVLLTARGPVVDLQSVRIAAGRRCRFQLLPVLRAPLSRYRHDLATPAHDRLARAGRSVHRYRLWHPVVLGHSGAATGSALPWRSAPASACCSAQS